MTYERLVPIVFLTFFALEFLVERVLALLNARHVRAHSNAVPDAFKDSVDPETYRKSVDYTLTRLRFGTIEAAEHAVLKLVFLFSGLLPWLSARSMQFISNGYIGGAAYLMAIAFIGSLVETPLDLYSTFVIEAKFGFNKISFKEWLTDRVKEGLLAVLIMGPFIAGLLWLILKTGPLWWLWAALFLIGFQMTMSVLYPMIISPLFNKFKPLEDGELRRALDELAKRCHFAASGIYVMDGSRRSTHSNAYFTGLGGARRIVLYDTLVEHLATGELAAVLAHEIGHFKLKHIPKGMLLGCAIILGGFYAFSLALHWAPLYAAFGGGTWPADSSSPQGVAQGFSICMLIVGALTFWRKPLTHALSRKFEYEADAFAKTQTDEKSLRGALMKLFTKNLSNPMPHPLYSAYHYSHPSMVERLKAM